MNLGISVWALKRSSPATLAFTPLWLSRLIRIRLTIMHLHITTIAGLMLGLCSASTVEEVCTSRDVVESLNRLELDARRSMDIIRSGDPDSGIVAKHPVCDILLFCWHLFPCLTPSSQLRIPSTIWPSTRIAIWRALLAPSLRKNSRRSAINTTR